MRVALVGPRDARMRLRVRLGNLPLEIAGEFETMAEARASGLDVSALMVAPETPATASGATDEGAAFDEALTSREREVLELMADGLPNRGIAARLGISDQTVKFHVASILGKLRAANRTEAVRRAARRGLLSM